MVATSVAWVRPCQATDRGLLADGDSLGLLDFGLFLATDVGRVAVDSMTQISCLYIYDYICIYVLYIDMPLYIILSTAPSEGF